MLSSAGAVGSRKRLPTAWASFIFRSRVSSQPTVRAKREIVAMLTLALAASWSTVALADDVVQDGVGDLALGDAQVVAPAAYLENDVADVVLHGKGPGSGAQSGRQLGVSEADTGHMMPGPTLAPAAAARRRPRSRADSAVRNTQPDGG